MVGLEFWYLKYGIFIETGGRSYMHRIFSLWTQGLYTDFIAFIIPELYQVCRTCIWYLHYNLKLNRLWCLAQVNDLQILWPFIPIRISVSRKIAIVSLYSKTSSFMTLHVPLCLTQLSLKSHSPSACRSCIIVAVANNVMFRCWKILKSRCQ